MCKAGDVFVVNDQCLKVPAKFDCKTRNCIYVAQCKLCCQIRESDYQVIFEDTYFGQTMQKFNQRVNGHRSCFKFEERNKSALSMHAFEHHGAIGSPLITISLPF